MTLIDIGLYLPIILLVFHASKGRSLVAIKNIKIGSFKGRQSGCRRVFNVMTHAPTRTVFTSGAPASPDSPPCRLGN